VSGANLGLQCKIRCSFISSAGYIGYIKIAALDSIGIIERFSLGGIVGGSRRLGNGYISIENVGPLV